MRPSLRIRSLAIRSRRLSTRSLYCSADRIWALRYRCNNRFLLNASVFLYCAEAARESKKRIRLKIINFFMASRFTEIQTGCCIQSLIPGTNFTIKTGAVVQVKAGNFYGDRWRDRIVQLPCGVLRYHIPYCPPNYTGEILCARSA